MTPLVSIPAAVDYIDFDVTAGEGLIAYIPWPLSDSEAGEPQFMNLAGDPIVPPAGYRRQLSPRVLAHPDGGFDVLWAEADADSRQGGTFLRRLYHATYIAGRGWSEPTQVYSSDGLTWDRDVAEVVRGADGLLRVAVPELGSGVIVLTQTANSTFETRKVPLIGPVYAQVVADDETTVLAVAVDVSDRLRAPHGVANSVFAATWTRTAPEASLTRIQLSEQGQATDPKLLVTASSEMHALWRQHVGNSWPTTLRHWMRAADGAWTHVDDIGLPGLIAAYDVTEEGAAGLLALVAGANGELWSARWRQGWTVQSVLEERVNGTSRLVLRPDPTAIISVVNCEQSGVQLVLVRF